GRHIFTNSAGVKLLGASSPDQILGKPVMDVISLDYREIVAERMQKAIETGITPATIEEKFIRLDGTEIDVEVRAIPVVYQGKPAMQTVVRDITERRQMEEERGKLELMKTEFTSNISHELRTPLQSIKGFTKLMLQGKVPDPETQKEFLTIIDGQSENLSTLIDSLLDMSRIESCRFDINRAPMSLRDLIQGVVHEYHSMANGKNIALTEEIPAALPEIEADEERLRQVIVNLLGNAIKFSKDGGKITVKAGAEDGKVLVQVTDSGIGIPEEAMEHLFERFYQGNGSITRTYGGSGLGLFISKQIIEAHGGRIWAESKPGIETTLFFIIPRVSKKGHKKLGEILVEDGLITKPQLNETLRKQRGQK
ncbi:MAG: PAS domain-containing sensor histidine kinase, partial [Dehalococcoidia bacterium]|nr:PAS domain-containing sensor histidine kinase [Dehalococcoidia bacterium]